MKIFEIIKSIDKSDHNRSPIHFHDLSMEVFPDISIPYHNFEMFHSMLKSYYIKKWVCTGATVGISAIFLDNKLIAISKTPSRSSSTVFEFLSWGHFYDLRDFMIECIEYGAEPTIINLIDHDEIL